MALYIHEITSAWMQLTDRKAWSESITILLKAHRMDFWEVTEAEGKKIELSHTPYTYMYV